MAILIKKFVSSPFRTPKLTYTSGDTEYTADFTEEWGPEFSKAVQAVEALAVELFRISPDHLSRMELGSAEWVTKDGRTKYRISAEAILKTRLSYIVGPCIMKTPWLNDEDLDGIADDAGERMESLREVCAEYVIGLQREQLRLFQYEEIAELFAGRAAPYVDDALKSVEEMNWTLCSERLPELKPVGDSAVWSGWVLVEGWIYPVYAVRTGKYLGFTDGDEGWLYEIKESDFDRVKWADFPANTFDEK